MTKYGVRKKVVRPEDIPDEEVRKFMLERYPKYADNLELGRILYMRFMKKMVPVIRGSSKFKKIKVADVKPGQYAELVGVVADVSVSEYQGGEKTKRKRPEPGEKLVTWYINGFLLGDDTGNIYVTYIAREKLDINIGDEVVVRGRGKKWRNNLEFMAFEVEKVGSVASEESVVSEEQVSDDEAEVKTEPEAKADEGNDELPEDEKLRKIVSAVKIAGGLKYGLFENLLKRYGVKKDDLLKWVEIVYDKKGNPEKVVYKHE